MPSYQFECPNCGFVDDFYSKKIIDSNERTCPKCQFAMSIVLFAPMSMKIDTKGTYILHRGWNNEKPEHNLAIKKRQEKNG